MTIEKIGLTTDEIKEHLREFQGQRGETGQQNYPPGHTKEEWGQLAEILRVRMGDYIAEAIVANNARLLTDVQRLIKIGKPSSTSE